MRQRFHIISALLVLAMSTMAGAAGHGRADAPPIARPRTAVVPPFISAIDTMKESRDTETRPLSDAAIADDVNLAASLNPNYITVDTHFEYPDYMARWVAAIRATGRHVWFRIHPNQWGDNNGTTGIMTPAQYESAERAFLQANLALFQPGDILDPCPEPENGTYWLATYGSGWTANAPNPATQEYNAFIRATSDIADSVLQGAGIYGVITTVRSTNSFFATHPGPLEAATVARLGRVTVDSYPDQNLTDPAQAAAARVSEYRAIYAAWGGAGRGGGDGLQQQDCSGRRDATVRPERGVRGAGGAGVPGRPELLGGGGHGQLGRLHAHLHRDEWGLGAAAGGERPGGVLRL